MLMTGRAQSNGQESRSLEKRAYLVVPVMFADTQSIPLKPTADYLNLITDPQFGADLYYRVASNNRLSLEGSRGAEPIILPKRAADYISKGAAWEITGPGWYSHQRLIDDIGPILEQRYDLHKFYGVAVFPNVSDKIGHGSAYRTVYRIKGDEKASSLPVIFVNPGPVSLASMVHEVGHHLDIGHVTVQSEAVKYDLSGMSLVGAFLPRLNNVSCDHIMWHKELLGWTTPEDVRTVDAPLDEVVRIFPRSGDRKGLRMLKLPLEAYGQYLTLEAVLPAGIDRIAGVPGFGVLAHKVNQLRMRRANLGLFPEPYLPEAQVSARGTIIYSEGDEWKSNDASQATFRVVKVTDAWCDLLVTLKKVIPHVANNQMRNRVELTTCHLVEHGGKVMFMGLKPFGDMWGGEAQVFGYGDLDDGVDIELPSTESGEREVLLGYTIAPDYGIVEVQMNDDPSVRLDEWGPEIAISGQKSLGRHTIHKGINIIHVRLVGKNHKWGGEHLCYGFDCISLRQ